MTFPEKAVVEIWQHRLIGRTDLTTEDGRPIQVIYPGMINGDRGPDFVGAVIRTNCGVIRGGVEIHVASGGWRGHGHQEDTAYNDVILHVVYRHDRKKAVRLQNGHAVPTLVLDKFVECHGAAGNRGVDHIMLPDFPCRDVAGMRNGAFLAEVLETAGEARFLARTAGYKLEIIRVGAPQALYTGIMESLGYTKNKAQMKNLAGLLPLAKLEALAVGDPQDTNYLFRLQSLLLGTAGLLPGQRGERNAFPLPVDLWLTELESYWKSLGEKSYLGRDDWNFFKVRPRNHPVLRLATMGYLLFRYRREGILSGLVENISSDYRNIVGSLYIPVKNNRIASLGKERAAAIVVNVLLPVAAARAQLASNRDEFQRILEIYHQYPRLALNNLEKHMKHQLRVEKGLITGACQQQGLIHIYRTQCSRGSCPVCPLNVSTRKSDK